MQEWERHLLLLSSMAASDVEDGEIVGEVNENYEQCISAPEPNAAKHGAAATSAAAAHKQQLPGWEDEQQPAGHMKRKPKKERKKKHKDAAGGPAEAGDGHDAADAPDSQGQQATYVNVYGSNVSGTPLNPATQIRLPCLILQDSLFPIGVVGAVLQRGWYRAATISST